ncbi:hypothetical protein RAA17_18290 [Komagataeibacter rhaeticus]|nr:hypothetical protein [Komagataeibacter rhaeticus]
MRGLFARAIHLRAGHGYAACRLARAGGLYGMACGPARAARPRTHGNGEAAGAAVPAAVGCGSADRAFCRLCAFRSSVCASVLASAAWRAA